MGIDGYGISLVVTSFALSLSLARPAEHIGIRRNKTIDYLFDRESRN
jgi:hypothetical protein